MSRLSSKQFVGAVLLLIAFASYAMPAEGMISTMATVSSVPEAGGFRIVPVPNATVNQVIGDEASPQIFEIVRPHNAPFTIGRLHTSCSCVQLEAPQRTFAKGERAFLRLRNVRTTPPNGHTYALFVQITSPVKTTLRQDTYMISDRYRVAPPLVTPGPYRIAANYLSQ